MSTVELVAVVVGTLTSLSLIAGALTWFVRVVVREELEEKNDEVD